MAIRRIGQILVDMGFINDDQLEMLLEEQQARPDELLGQIAISLDMIDEEQLAQALAEQMGLQALIVPEEFGGQGFGYVELIIVLEEMGRSLLCAPFFSSVVLAANTLIHSGDDAAKAAHLPGIASGETIATLEIGRAHV